MSRTTLTGSRIRQRRIVAGKKQADLARVVGISPSYLNLIEHNRRRIGGKLINDIARELGVEPTVLTEGAEAALLTTLREAAEGHDAATAELDRLEEFAGRFPGWAALLAETRRRANELERSVQVLSDRMTHDPFLSASLHEVISTVTAIRSTATILVETRDIDPEWQNRFHRNIADESRRLTEGAQALVHYLDEANSADVAGSTPQEELDAWMRARSYHVTQMEGDSPADPDALIAGSAELTTPGAIELGAALLRGYRRDAERMPLQSFSPAAAEVSYDPVALAARFDVSLLAVFRRLASLPPGDPGAGIGIVVCDGSGTLTFRKPVDGFVPPRFSAACPLWPLYQALLRPMIPQRRLIEMGGRTPQTFVSYAMCQPAQPAGFEGPQVFEAAMLILPPDLTHVPEGEQPLPVGSSCRICPRGDCVARREPSIMAEQEPNMAG